VGLRRLEVQVRESLRVPVVGSDQISQMGLRPVGSEWQDLRCEESGAGSDQISQAGLRQGTDNVIMQAPKKGSRWK